MSRSGHDSSTLVVAGTRWAASLLFCLGLGACISTSPDPDHLAEIDGLVAARAGTPLRTSELLATDPGARGDAPAGILSLEEAIVRALSRNLSLVASAENVAIAQAALAQAGLISNPTASFSAQWIHPQALSWDLVGSLMQELNGILTRSTRVEIARAQRFQIGIDLAGQAFDISQQVESKYRGLAHLLRARKLADRIVEQYDRALKAAEARARVGVIPTPDVNRARIQWEDAQRQVRKLDAQYRRGARELNWLLGVSSAPAWNLPETLGQIPSELPTLPELSAAEALGLRYRLDLQRAELDVRVGESTVTLAGWGFVPDVQAGVAVEHDETRTLKLGPSFAFTIPIFDPGLVAYQLAQARLRLASKTHAALEGQVRQDVRSAHATLELDLDDVRFFRERIIPQQEENIRLADQSFRLGNTDLDSLLNTLRDYVSSLQSYEDSVQTYFDDRVAFQRAVGLIWTRLSEEERKLKEDKK
ncbi:MAG TPA: TolC family protein [Planctomycetota bacterium]|nr:TolC family protein [Planctomycetota bacterium]